MEISYSFEKKFESINFICLPKTRLTTANNLMMRDNYHTREIEVQTDLNMNSIDDQIT